MTESTGRSTRSHRLRRVLAAAGAVLALPVLADPAAAHAGSVHRGTPHWVFLGVIVAGVATLGLGLAFGRGRWDDRPSRAVSTVLAGATLVAVGLIALVEVQVEPPGAGNAPIPRDLYPVVSLAVGNLVVLASVVVGLWRWPDRPLYIALGVALGLYVAYPTLIPGIAIFHPAGYLLVFVVLALVGYLLSRDVRPGLSDLDPLSRRTGAAAATLFVVFMLFSSGQFTLNPVTGASGPTGQFVVIYEYANPLVMWPAVEFYFPSVPFFGALSIGTAIMFGLLGTLVGVNAALATRIYAADAGVAGPETTLGALATTGASACCCCAPAAYGVASAVLGLSASPLYWVFVDSQSPLGSIFYVSAVALLTGSAIHLARTVEEAGICAVPADGDTA